EQNREAASRQDGVHDGERGAEVSRVRARAGDRTHERAELRVAEADAAARYEVLQQEEQRDAGGADQRTLDVESGGGLRQREGGEDARIRHAVENEPVLQVEAQDLYEHGDPQQVDEEPAVDRTVRRERGETGGAE